MSIRKKILITGGTGMVGRSLSEKLVQQKFDVTILSRTVRSNTKNIRYAYWSPEQGLIDEDIVQSSEIIIHLAGAGIADKRWTAARKKYLLDSRITGLRLIRGILKNKPHTCKHLISASGVGYYGLENNQIVFDETAPCGEDFLGKLCERWEQEVDKIGSLRVATSILRTGVVLDMGAGALKKMLPLFRLGLGSSLGTGQQYFPWISLIDLVSMYLYVIHRCIFGVYNAVAPELVTNATFSRQFAKSLKRPFLMPPIPSAVLRFFYGEMSSLLLTGTSVSADKIQQAGFNFEHPSLSVFFENSLRR